MRQNDPEPVGGPTLTIWEANNYNTWVSTLGLSWMLANNLGLTAYVEHTARTGSLPDVEFTRDAVGVTLTYQYDF